MNTPSIPLFSVTAFGPIDWFAQLAAFPVISLEQHEHYRKQTWRNRYRIDGPNGFPDLSIPVIAPNHTAVKDVRIQYTADWQRQHWRTITTSYRRAPFFEYYESGIRRFFETQEYETLLEFNLAAMNYLFKRLKIETEIRLSENFEAAVSAPHDFREAFSPKKKTRWPGDSSRYIQVFSDRHDFMPGLSVLDLLFCEGPQASQKLANVSLRK